MKTQGEKLKRKREAAKLSVRQLDALTKLAFPPRGVSFKEIYLIESGRTNPTDVTLHIVHETLRAYRQRGKANSNAL